MFKDTDNFAKIVHLTHDMEKLAIFVSALPRPQQRKIIQLLKDNDVKKLIEKMSNLKKCSRKKVDEVLKEFYDLLTEKKDIIFEDNKGRDFIIETLGEERARCILGQIVSFDREKVLESLELVDIKTLSNFVLNEHPQTITLILAHLPSDKRGAVLKNLPEGLQAEVTLRMANLDTVSPEVLSQLDDVLKTELSSLGTFEYHQAGGIESVADMINNLDVTSARSIMVRLEMSDPELAKEVQKLMFTFNDLIYVDNKGIQELLKTVDNSKLIFALKGADLRILDKVYTNISKRASEMLKEDLKACGKIKKDDQLKARQEIITIIKELESKGKAIISKDTDEYV